MVYLFPSLYIFYAIRDYCINIASNVSIINIAFRFVIRTEEKKKQRVVARPFELECN